jgi:hypothetical protein
MDKVYGYKGRNGTDYYLYFLKKKVLLHAVLRQRPAPIITNND